MTYRDLLIKRALAPAIPTAIPTTPSVTPSVPATAASSVPATTPVTKNIWQTGSESPAEVATKNIYKDPTVTKQQYDEAAAYNQKTFGRPNIQTVPWNKYNEKVPVLTAHFGYDGAYHAPPVDGSKAYIRLPSGFSTVALRGTPMSGDHAAYNNLTDAWWAQRPEALYAQEKQHEFNHASSTSAATPILSANWRDDDDVYGSAVWPTTKDRVPFLHGGNNYFDRGVERDQAVRSLQQGMFQDLGSRAHTAEEFKTRVDGYLNNKPGFDRSRLNPEQQRYLNYLENTKGRVLKPSTLEQDAINAPGLSQSQTPQDHPAYKLAFEKRANDWYKYLCS